MTTKDKKTSAHLISGFIGGLTSSVILQPFDLIKTRMQQESSSLNIVASKNSSKSIKSIFNELSSIKELWRGTLPSALRTSIGSALYLSSLNVIRTNVSNLKSKNLTAASPTIISSSSKLPKLSPTENLMTGMVSRSLVGFITMPITILKVRFESNLYNYTSLTNASAEIFKQEGVVGFFRGFGATCLRDAPNAGLYILFYEKWKHVLPILWKFEHDNKDEMLFNTSKSAVINSSSAVLSASLATTITAPFDTIKTNMQLNPNRYKTFRITLKLLLNENWRRLFDGLSLRLFRKAGSSAIAWGIYEELIKL